MEIKSNVEYFSVAEEKAVIKAIASRRLSGNGPICRRVEQQIGEMFNVKHVLLTPSGTHALEIAMLALDIALGDEVIVPSFTFVSSATCVVLRGAKPVFAEVKPETLNLDPDDIRRRITSRTKAIILVHYAGVSCDMDEIMQIAAEHNLYVVEDAAQGVDARYKGRPLGTIGHIGCYSFHGTKNISCGEGGAFLTNDSKLARKAEIIHEKGTNRAAFLRGQIDKYTWVSVGSSYVLSDLLAALLEVQLTKRAEIKAKRQMIWNRYYEGLSPLASEGKVILPTIPSDCESNYHIFFFRLRDEETRNALLDGLRAEGIGATFHYIPLHASPYGRNVLGCEDELPITEKASRTLIRLPIYPSLTVEEIDHILNMTQTILPKVSKVA